MTRVGETDNTDVSGIATDLHEQIGEFLSHRDIQIMSIADTYWVNTKTYPRPPLLPVPEDPIALSRLETEHDHEEIIEAMIVSGGKRYESFPTVPLPAPGAADTANLCETMRSHRSVREFDTESPVSLAAISAVLSFSYGWNASRSRDFGGFKHVPAAGGLYPLELYVVALRVDGLDSGMLYHYRPTGHLLEQLSSVRPETISHLFAATHWIDQAGAVIFITGVLPRLAWKYGDRALRYLLLDAGHVAQNACLVGGSLGMGLCPIVSFYDDCVHDFLDIDGVSELVLYALALGTPMITDKQEC